MNPYIPVLIFLIFGIGFGIICSAASWALGPRKYDKVKYETYECGVPIVGNARDKMSVKFYLTAILFILFGIGKFRLLGLIQPLADAIKLIFKEEVVPDAANKIFFHLAPVFSLFPSLMIAAAIPFGHPVNILGYEIPLQVVSLDVGFLYIFAFSSIGVYGVTLAGWASNNKYSLLGGIRSSAQ